MELVGSRLGHQVHAPAWIAAHFSRRLRLKAELGNGVNWQRNTGNVFDAALVHGRDIVPPVIVVGAVNLPVHLVSTRSVH